MFFEREFGHYFAKSDNGVSYHLRVAVEYEDGSFGEELEPEKWSKVDAKKFTNYCVNEEIQTAFERIESHTLARRFSPVNNPHLI